MRTLYTEAKNIRSVGDTPVRFTPDPTGVTAVAGPNGSGKTTLTTLIPLLAAWGDAKSVAGSMGEILAEGAHTGRAVWAFEQSGHTYVVTRTVTRTNTGASSKVKIEVDGSTEVTKGMRAAESAQFLTDVLGVGPDEFLTTSLIAQGEIAALTSATPAVVRDQIRKTLGLDRVVRAATRLEREVAPAKKNLPEAPDPATVRRARSAAIDAAGAEASARAAAEAATAAADEKNMADTAAGQEFAAARDRYETWKSSAGSLAEARRALAEAESAAAAAHAEVDPLVAPAGFSGSPSLEQVTGVYQQGAALLEKVTRSAAAEPAVAGDEERAAAEKAVADALTALESARAAAEQLPDPRADREAAVSARSRAADLSASADLLDGHGDCPTCGTHLADSAALVASLREQVVRLTSDADQATARAERADQAARDAQQAVQAAERQVEAGQRDLAATAAAADAHAAWAAEHEALLGGATLEGLQGQVTAISALGTAMTAAGQADQRVAAARARVDEISVTADGDGDALAAEFSRTQEAASAAQAEARRAAEEKSAATATHSAALGEWRRLTASADQLDEAVAARAAAEAEIGAKLTAAQVLREFAAALTAEKVTAIEDAVNALMRGISTPFTRFRLGADFAPAVQVGSVWRPTHELSGGEAAVVGLLLRIGVVAAITGGTLDVTLTADEPLANLDGRAREQVAELLGQLPCPVTVISHASESTDAADRVVDVSRGLDGHTQVRTR